MSETRTQAHAALKQAHRAAKRGDLVAAERWTKLAERLAATAERIAALPTPPVENEEELRAEILTRILRLAETHLVPLAEEEARAEPPSASELLATAREFLEEKERSSSSFRGSRSENPEPRR